MQGQTPIRFSMSYAKGLAEYGFNYHSIIRPEYKINYKRLDWYMNNLIRSKKVDVAFACIEPDIDKYTCKPSGYNHIHFAYKGNRLTRAEASKLIRCKSYFLRDILPVYNGMNYFTKHVGKSLSYHNIYV
tara:strand:- start:1312 stop:1701 length:390 start_codon:yes stop_codon:yes gene_type:complete